MKRILLFLLVFPILSMAQCPNGHSEVAYICIGQSAAAINLHLALPNDNCEYSIEWTVESLAKGIQNVAATPMTAMQDIISVDGIPNMGGVYSGTIYVRNISTNCTVGFNATIEVQNPYATVETMDKCGFPTSVVLSIDNVNASSYSIDWAHPNMQDVVWTNYSWPPPTITADLTPVGNLTQTILGTFTVRSQFAGCEKSYPIVINRGYPVINTTSPSVCSGTTSVDLGYTITWGSQTRPLPSDTYIIAWNAAAASAGLLHVNNASLTGSSIHISGVPTLAGTYTGNLFVSVSPTGCINVVPKSISIIVNPKPILNVSPPAPVFCPSTSGRILTASGASTYVWSPSSGLSATTGAVVNAAPSSQQTYKLVGTSNFGCKDSVTTTVTVGPSSGAISQDYGLPTWGFALLRAGNELASNFQWSSGATYQSTTVYVEGEYTVDYDILGCRVTGSIFVQGCGDCGGPARKAQDPDVDVPVDSEHPFGVSPNPASTTIRVILSSPALEDSPVKFYDVLGRERKSEFIEKGRNEKTIPVSDFEPGVYIINIKDAKGYRQRKLIIEGH